MKTVICDISAIEMWNRGLCKDAKPSKMKCLETCASSVGDVPLETLRNLGLSTPIHVMTAQENHHRVQNAIHVHIWSGEIAPRTVVRLSEELYVASPEASFLQLSRKLPLLDLISIGDELCGTYATIGTVAGTGHAGYDFIERDPLTTPSKLLSYLAGAGYGGRSKTMRAAKHVVSLSNSPMETATEMLCCLPPKYGGYSLPKPLMNFEIRLPSHIAKLTPFNKLTPDLYWPDFNIAIEYKGNKDHSEEWHRTRDAVRENLLAYCGVRVLSVTKAQYASITGMYVVAKQLSDAMGHRIKIDIRSDAHRHLHSKLCDAAHLRQELW